ncbi:MAG: Bifunctional protein: zinc-containing alcohol dehydrogenase; quinone oxidoreductase (NADPH:quinone reductase); Similar to arginate lyase [uncultured Nocardioides sp.]|uniref:Bifunctional protein: zinc-containing alcohol dehydrogenase quinone oxidoreductase ( NADPH:quinone reductase) Similar to arginate lyase n=1 Tax=uncultured Nocardioides sp. TaxID=198441 RepID=A0A6J4P8T0_9ACTN|nr:MAG: Bifunctional protein: zinc-containing alcohol dehydrogenase; quinone oxidoreductase (NADPH:quinone reductase); Similar to arginate lyase [uncultured Nocardioides sp.]
MRAAVTQAYGAPEVVHVSEVPAPRPGAKQVLVRVRASAVTAADSRVRGARFPRGYALLARLIFGLRRPRRAILGGVVSGVVEAVGARAEGFAVGDEVCGSTSLAFGCHAELVAVPVKRLVPKPPTVSHEEAAGVLFGGSTALHFLRDLGHVRAGQTVLVNGASGAVGTNAVQLARHYGAEVTAVTSAANATLLEELGAHHVVDYVLAPVAETSQRYDVVLDTVGNLGHAGRRLLAPGGVLLLVASDLGETLRARGNVKAGPAPERAESFTTLLDLVAEGTLTVVNQHVLGLEDIVRAHEIADSGRKVGNVVVRP